MQENFVLKFCKKPLTFIHVFPLYQKHWRLYLSLYLILKNSNIWTQKLSSWREAYSLHFFCCCRC